MTRWAVLFLCVALGIGSTRGLAQRSEIMVSGASSLTDVLGQIARLYEAQFNERVVLNLGASNTLARQIASGARVDLFISADDAQMDVVREDIVSGSRVDLLTNQLVVAVPDDRPRLMRSIRELADPAIARIAVGDTVAVPAGVYARRYLQAVGLWGRLESRLVPSGNVRLALAAVENGGADAAIVYRTDLAAAPRARVAFVVPLADGPRIVYPAAVMRTGANQGGARRLLAFLRQRPAMEVFERAGFSAVSSPASSTR